jgi:hypothetical protein
MQQQILRNKTFLQISQVVGWQPMYVRIYWNFVREQSGWIPRPIFSPFERMFNIFKKITLLALICTYILGFFLSPKKLFIKYDVKCFGCILGDFFTQLSGHPVLEAPKTSCLCTYRRSQRGFLLPSK